MKHMDMMRGETTEPQDEERRQREEVRFWRLVYRGEPDGCWIWLGCTNTKRYGRFAVRSDGQWRLVSAHRYSWGLAGKTVPEGYDLHHTCTERRCVNPDHLEVITHQEHGRLSNPNALKRECPTGHPYDEKNTYRNLKGWRFCKACRSQREKAKRKAASTGGRTEHQHEGREHLCLDGSVGGGSSSSV